MQLYLKYKIQPGDIGEIVGFCGHQPSDGQWDHLGIEWVKVPFSGDPYDNYLDLSGDEIKAVLKDEITANWNTTAGAVGDKFSLVGLPGCEIFVDGKSQGDVTDGVYTMEPLDAGRYSVKVKSFTYKEKTYQVEVS